MIAIGKAYQQRMSVYAKNVEPALGEGDRERVQVLVEEMQMKDGLEEDQLTELMHLLENTSRSTGEVPEEEKGNSRKKLLPEEDSEESAKKEALREEILRFLSLLRFLYSRHSRCPAVQTMTFHRR